MLVASLPATAVDSGFRWEQLLSDSETELDLSWQSLRWNDWQFNDGKLAVVGEWTIVEGRLVWLLTVPLDALGVVNESTDLRVESVSGKLQLKLDTAMSLQTQGFQQLDIERVVAGDFEATRIGMRFEMSDAYSLRVEQLAFDYAGGRIHLDPFTWNPETESLSLSLRLEAINMQHLAELLPDWGFTAAGKMDGRVVIRLSSDGLDLLPGSLRYVAESKGRIRYRNEGWLTRGRVADTQARVLRAAEEAFADLELEQLELQIHGFEQSGPQAVLEIAGQGWSQELNTSVPVRMQINLSFSRREIESLPLFQFLNDGFFSTSNR